MLLKKVHLSVKLFADGDVYEHSVQAEHHHLLSCRPDTRQRVATAPVSRAKASLLSRQGHAVRLHKVIISQRCRSYIACGKVKSKWAKIPAMKSQEHGVEFFSFLLSFLCRYFFSPTICPMGPGLPGDFNPCLSYINYSYWKLLR